VGTIATETSGRSPKLSEKFCEAKRKKKVFGSRSQWVKANLWINVRQFRRRKFTEIQTIVWRLIQTGRDQEKRKKDNLEETPGGPGIQVIKGGNGEKKMTRIWNEKGWNKNV